MNPISQILTKNSKLKREKLAHEPWEITSVMSSNRTGGLVNPIRLIGTDLDEGGQRVENVGERPGKWGRGDAGER